ncbi:ComF family protein [Mucilaginibacter sp. JRF]|uniref:ComF family protein n=1 Tax=Mucilaginibacter sp. JRF TaxID=2780088 RepID=UPI0018821468|nr:phosphoribosyltransferase family protein [Mucilaginibacter sp. JRF]MBE9586755.1 ComF family protein [Mucilaginibacter sp. JRF]
MWLRNTYLADFIALIFPDLCAACNRQLLKGEQVICTACKFDLPYTNFHQQKDNIVARQFWGKLKIEHAYALLYFTKGGKVQNMVHRFKYEGEKQVGVALGNIAGEQLKGLTTGTFDYIIPVPLHKSKLRKRGYNQSKLFADGLAQKLDAPVELDNLVRVIATETQTRKSRFARFENMREVFAVANAGKLANKHILLVDDIVTTGSTLEACGIELLKVPGLKLSIATIAYAE